jgi:hypothetical protein
MSEHAEHNPNDHEDPLPGVTWIVGIGGAIVLVVVFEALTALFYHAREDEIVKVVHHINEPEVAATVEAQEALLHGTSRTETRPVLLPDGKIKLAPDGAEETELVTIPTIPIDRAMEEIVTTYGGAHPAPGSSARAFTPRH